MPKKVKRAIRLGMLSIALAGRLGAEQASVSLQEKDGGYTLEGTFFLQAPRVVVWNVLTDYDHIANFVSSMKHSKIREQTLDGYVVDQKMRGEFLFFKRTVHVALETKEQEDGVITFKDISHEDFDRYEGSWKVEPTVAGTVVIYKLDVKSNFPAPGFVKRNVVKNNVSALLEELKAEMLQRSEKENLTAKPAASRSGS